MPRRIPDAWYGVPRKIALDCAGYENQVSSIVNEIKYIYDVFSLQNFLMWCCLSHIWYLLIVFDGITSKKQACDNLDA